MSSTAGGAPAPWRSAFLAHVAQMPQASFTLATLHPVPADEQPDGQPSSIPVVPRARTCIFRGLWGALPQNEHNAAPRNPAGVYESDLPVFTTDSRMDKAAEIQASAPHGDLGLGGAVESGGGGPVEAVVWAEGAATQWRLRGAAWVLGRDIDRAECEAVRKKLLSRMRRSGKDDGAGWSFATEVTAHFGNLSPAMRGTFRHPPPGMPVTIPPEEGLGLGQTVEELDDEIARSNFRVVVVLPTAVDEVNLSDPKKPWRRLYTYRAGEQAGSLGVEYGRWETEEVWP